LQSLLGTRFWAATTGQRREDVVNTDQGSQFSSEAFTGQLQQQGIRISVDGRGRSRNGYGSV